MPLVLDYGEIFGKYCMRPESGSSVILVVGEGDYAWFGFVTCVWMVDCIGVVLCMI